MYILLLTFTVFIVQNYFFNLKRSKQAFKITVIQPTWNDFCEGQCLGRLGFRVSGALCLTLGMTQVDRASQKSLPGAWH